MESPVRVIWGSLKSQISIYNILIFIKIKTFIMNEPLEKIVNLDNK